MTTKDIAVLLVSIAVVAGCYIAGYHEGKKTTEYKALVERQAAIDQLMASERQKQNELSELNRSLTADNTNLNRLLRTKGKQPADYQSCLVERDRLRTVVKQFSVLSAQCRKGLGYAEIQLK